MYNFARTVFFIQEKIRKTVYVLFRECVIKMSLGGRGRNVHIAEKCDIKGIENIYLGDNSSIGRGSVLWTTRAKIIIEDKVITGPNITIITGNHKINVVGKCIADVTDAEKDKNDDQDVIIKHDVWIGANVTILKGVTIEEGCVIAAGAVVTKSTTPYGIYAGVPARRIAERFEARDLDRHRQMLNRVIDDETEIYNK